jgi:hypothetical protein
MNVRTPENQKDDIFEVVLNTVSDGITVIDKDLRIKLQNRVISQLYGSSMIGQQDVAYQGKIQEIQRPSRLYVFSDGVCDITKVDGSIWGLNEF